MSSKLIADICEITNVKNHPNADRLDVVFVKGWQCVVGRDQFKTGDLVVFIPPDSMMPEQVSKRLGIHDYLKGNEQKRVGQVRLRGEPSFGVVLPVSVIGREVKVGEDVTDYFHITKYEPPILGGQYDQAAPDHPLFPKYTDIENLRNYPTCFEEGETVIVTEKIHGTNVRLGMIGGVRMAGSHNRPRKAPEDAADMAKSFYWFPWTIKPVEEMIWALAMEHSQVILYGETYGRVQSLRYGLPHSLAFRAFDLMLDGRYADSSEFFDLCERFGVEHVPVVGMMKYSLGSVIKSSEGPSLVPGADHIREGVVVKPLVERYSSVVGGRLTAKYVSSDYLLGKHHERDTKDA